MSQPILSQAYLRSLFDYDAETGVFTRRVNSGKARAGTRAGTDDGMGYLQITLAKKKYRLHRLAFMYVNGRWPEHHVDHINRNRADNRWCNLREATQGQNNQNMGMSASNTSGFVGVSWVPNICKWEARISINYKPKMLGYFSTPQEASAAYLAAKAVYHPGYTP